ncbi:hypothetical protein EAH_00054790 [Eimeria acervulina]|uniref:Uncharacterized protein n=1 Tax=Eimeria acervulina TaxID=5801 RepID=U6GMB1_EIMAC|nr:hypothetical protein EAH_00054790 [Eimeria acervulina]CDI80702.1 hypothetical protein EAH_00054790 [Eimeria acervulina]
MFPWKLADLILQGVRASFTSKYSVVGVFKVKVGFLNIHKQLFMLLEAERTPQPENTTQTIDPDSLQTLYCKGSLHVVLLATAFQRLCEAAGGSFADFPNRFKKTAFMQCAEIRSNTLLPHEVRGRQPAPTSSQAMVFQCRPGELKVRRLTTALLFYKRTYGKEG